MRPIKSKIFENTEYNEQEVKLFKEGGLNATIFGKIGQRVANSLDIDEIIIPIRENIKSSLSTKLNLDDINMIEIDFKINLRKTHL